MDHFDVIIIGAGLSGIGAARHLQQQCPKKTYTLLESRQAIGGTWDLFQYPGIRSDSDMHTLGYNFKPWRGNKSLADGNAIREYVQETAQENGISPHIRFGHKLVGAAWCSKTALWTLQIQTADTVNPIQLSCNFLAMCAGYYNYGSANQPAFENQSSFKGQVIHPQFWPDALDYRNKKVVIIGSGATAVTLVPAMASKAKKVTMLQRSPTYVVSRPAHDRVANLLRRLLPETWAYVITRWKNISWQQRLYQLTRSRPQIVSKKILRDAKKKLGAEYVAAHFTPDYNPWDQRVCLIPDDDLFDAINSGQAEVITDKVSHFTETGIALQSGNHIDADIIVTATGLELQLIGGVDFSIDGKPVNFHQHWTYRGVMFSDVPNLINTFGYINASWTLRADLIAKFMCRLLNNMEKTATTTVTPHLRQQDKGMAVRPWIDDFSAGYIARSMKFFPMQGNREPWTNPQNYAKEKDIFIHGTLDDGVLSFQKTLGSNTLEKRGQIYLSPITEQE